MKNAASKILKYGVLNSSQVFLQRLKKMHFQKNSKQQTIPLSWNKITQKHKLPPFVTFFEQLKSSPVLDFETLLSSNYLNIPNEDIFLLKANSILHNQFEILHQKQQLGTEIFWQQDFKSNDTKPKNLFYQNIKIAPSTKVSLDDYLYDIKVPWELSRFHFLFDLGKAYEITSDENYPKKFLQLTEDWLNKNPFLMGVNWACPMEVSIRAINFIWAFHYFKNTQCISIEFWEKFTCSLYQHAYYLENNWEIFFRNNNHYIADLLGYFYLCLFFKNIKHFKQKQTWCYKKLLKEFYKQVSPDGTCYEGSTNYHKLVTEMYIHFQALCNANNLTPPDTFNTRLKKMLKFLQDCSDHKNNLVQIGDNDSGKIVTGINIPAKHHQEDILQHYPHFGVSIIKTQNWHISFRHPTYKTNQPSGHFHSDELSITLSVDGISVLVDPGTYVYTANPKWRNLLRSEQNHNSFFIKNNCEPLSLFDLPKVNQYDTSKIEETADAIVVTNQSNKYKKLRLTQYRKLNFSQNKQILEVEDYWKHNVKESPRSHWTLTFHPQITVIESPSENFWKIFWNDKILLYLKSSLLFTTEKGFYSKQYGVIEKTTKLTASSVISTDKKESIIFEKEKVQ